jgi:predicted metal-dependent hydrolase
MEQRFPPLTPSQRELLQKGILCFNQGQFFECHEVLEEAWLEASGDQKRFLQGLIQVAVALHHLRRGNHAGAGRLLTAGIEKLSGFSPRQSGLDIGNLLANLEPLRQKIIAGEALPNWQMLQILWEPPPNSSAR